MPRLGVAAVTNWKVLRSAMMQLTRGGVSLSSQSSEFKPDELAPLKLTSLVAPIASCRAKCRPEGARNSRLVRKVHLRPAAVGGAAWNDLRCVNKET